MMRRPLLCRRRVLYCCRWKYVRRRLLPFLSFFLVSCIISWQVAESPYFLQDFSIQACQLPNINYFDDSLKGAFWNMQTVNCTKWRAPVFWSTSGVLSVSTNTEFGALKCNYSGVEADGDNYIKPSLSDRGPLPAKPSRDFVLVECSDKNGTVYRDVKYNIVPKSPSPGITVKESEEQLSIILFGLDSVSRLVAERKLPISLKFFRETLKSFDFTGYTKVGDNTLPNLLAALNGQTLPEALVPTFDFPPFIKDLHSVGYVTSYAEDWVPYYPPLGFKYPLYTHNLRTYFLAGDIYKPWNKHHKNSKDPKCFSNEFKHVTVINFTDSFLRTYNDTLKASLSWIDEIGHHQSNFLEAGDNHVKTFFENLYNEGRLNKSVVVFFSDHGPRYGKVVERDLIRFTGRLPMLHIVLPKHIRLKYPQLVDNLRENTKRLTTPFDLHETLQDIMFSRFQEASERLVTHPLPRGISLFSMVPETRSCYDASVSEHYCPCYTLTDLPISDPEPNMAAEFMLDYINKLLVSHINKKMCARLKIKEITSAKRQNNHARSIESQSIVVVFSVAPGNGVYEGTVEIIKGEATRLLGDINRLTLYKDNAGCVDDAVLKLYCHCIQNSTALT